MAGLYRILRNEFRVNGEWREGGGEERRRKDRYEIDLATANLRNFPVKEPVKFTTKVKFYEN